MANAGQLSESCESKHVRCFVFQSSSAFDRKVIRLPNKPNVATSSFASFSIVPVVGLSRSLLVAHSVMVTKRDQAN